ncbi:MAG: hypothetical protein HYT87_13295 [Nitrospirae bacterium]|nr:hypothetical protein [Nitrospirota bacterium]
MRERATAAKTHSRFLPVLFLLITTYSSLITRSAYGEPYLAVRSGEKCLVCHVNMTGGGKRTDHGAKYGQKYLPIIESEPVSFRFSNVLAIGSDVRVDESNRRYRKPESLRSSLAPGVAPTKNGNGVEAGQASFYVEANMLDSAVNFYLDESFAPAATTREVFMRAEHLDSRSYVKVGHFFMPYGLRVVNNETFIREQTGYTMTQGGDGIELGLEPDPIDLTSVRIAVVDDAATGPDASGVVEAVHDLFRIGASGGYQSGDGSDRSALGEYLGIRLTRYAQILQELDFLSEIRPGKDETALIHYLEANVTPHKGVNLKGFYERWSPSKGAASLCRAGLDRFGGGVETFPVPFVRLGVSSSFTIVGDDYAPVLGHDRAFSFLAQAHLFF